MFRWQFMIVLTKSFLCRSKRAIKMQNNFIGLRMTQINVVFEKSIFCCNWNCSHVAESALHQTRRDLFVIDDYCCVLGWPGLWRSSSLKPPTHRAPAIVRWTGRHNNKINSLVSVSLANLQFLTITYHRNGRKHICECSSRGANLIWLTDVDMSEASADPKRRRFWFTAVIAFESHLKPSQMAFTAATECVSGSAHRHSSLLNGHRRR